MTMLAICSMLIGSTLAIRCRVIVLLPIIFLGSAVLVTTSAILGGAFSRIALMVIVFAASLQLGYVVAALMKYAVIPARAGHRCNCRETRNHRRPSSRRAPSPDSSLDSFWTHAWIQITLLALVIRLPPATRRLELNIKPADAVASATKQSSRQDGLKFNIVPSRAFLVKDALENGMNRFTRRSPDSLPPN